MARGKPIFDHKLVLKLFAATQGGGGGGGGDGATDFEGYDYVGASTGDYNPGAPANNLQFDQRILGVIVADPLTGGTAFVNGQDRAFPFIVARTGTVDRLAIEQITGAIAVSSRFAIYNNASRTRLYPTTLTFDSGVIDHSVGAGLKTFSTSLSWTAGSMLWVMWNTNSGAVSVRGVLAAAMRAYGGAKDVTGQDIDIYNGFTRNRAFAAFPDPYPADATALAIRANMPAVAARFSA